VNRKGSAELKKALIISPNKSVKQSLQGLEKWTTILYIANWLAHLLINYI